MNFSKRFYESLYAMQTNGFDLKLSVDIFNCTMPYNFAVKQNLANRMSHREAD